MQDGFEANQLRNFIETGNVPFVQNSVSYIFTCPRCLKHKKLYIRKRDGRFVCWRCGELEGFKGRAEWALTELYQIPVRELQEILYGTVLGTENRYSIQVDLFDFYGEGEEISWECPLPPMSWGWEYNRINEEAAQKGLLYLQNRGITLDLALKYDIRFSPSDQRVGIPVVVDGVMRGWQARYIHPTVTVTSDGRKREIIKILSTKGLTGGGALMFQDNLKDSPHAVLCEGPFDALKVEGCGGAVASMGKSINDRQLYVLRSSGIKRLYVAFDPDAAEDIMRIAREMNELELYYMEVPRHREDFGACTPEEAQAAFANAERFTSGRIFIDLKVPVWYR